METRIILDEMIVTRLLGRNGSFINNLGERASLRKVPYCPFRFIVQGVFLMDELLSVLGEVKAIEIQIEDFSKLVVRIRIAPAAV